MCANFTSIYCHLWSSKALHLRLRLILYITSVCSIMTYGSETWNFTQEVKKKMNDTNSQMLNSITGKSCREETVESTCSFNLLRAIRVRRLQWLGRILRLDADRLLQRVVHHVYDNRCEGDILSDTPQIESWDELKMWSADRKQWRIRVRETRSKVGVTITGSVFVSESSFAFAVSS